MLPLGRGIVSNTNRVMLPLPTLPLKTFHWFPVALKTNANSSTWPHGLASALLCTFPCCFLSFMVLIPFGLFFQFCQRAKGHSTCWSLCLECPPSLYLIWSTAVFTLQVSESVSFSPEWLSYLLCRLGSCVLSYKTPLFLHCPQCSS